MIAAAIEAALARHRAGDLAEAVAGYEAVLAAAPDQPDALNLLASARRSLGDPAAAVALARRAAAVAPDRADIRYNLGNALAAAAETDAAIEAFAAALRLQPGHADAAANMAIALARRGDTEAAVAAYEIALAADPSHRVAGLNLGNLLGEQGRAAEAIARLRRVVADHPALPEAHYNLGLNLLRAGDYATGFAEYEWRWRTADFSSPPRHTDIANWTGAAFPGRRLLIHAEQGLGDTIQFVRLVRHARSLGGSVTLEVPTVMRALLAGIADVVTDRVEPGHDLQTPLLGLPHRLGLSLGAVGMRAPYLAAEPARVARWRERLAPDGRPLVGLAWRGNATSPADRGRSLPDVALLRPIVACAGIRTVALHKLDPDELAPAATATGWRVAAAPFLLEHPGPDFDASRDAFLDTAAVMTLTDRIVTTDTSIAHLAGALMRPTFLLLRAVADWRWLIAREDSPWYPSLRLFRQPRPGDFASGIGRIAAIIDAEGPPRR